MSVRRLICLALVWLSLMPNAVSAHALEPGYLEISVIAGGSHRVFWRVPDVNGAPMRIGAVLPEHCDERQSPYPATSDGRAWVSSWAANCPGGLAGGTIMVEGLDLQQTDVLVRYPSADGRPLTQRLTPASSSFTVPQDPSAFSVVKSYLPLGVEHILAGADHLLFVFALVLLISGWWKLIGAITAFTVAHSLTMAAATLGWVTLPGPPVEAVIALSIVFLAAELMQGEEGRERLSARKPWILSFVFGLLHGFGFAGALREIGLPHAEVPLALLSFNLGVEIGQLLFVGTVLCAGFAAKRLAPIVFDSFGPRGAFRVFGIYAIGSISAFWVFDRLSGF